MSVIQIFSAFILFLWNKPENYPAYFYCCQKFEREKRKEGQMVAIVINYCRVNKAILFRLQWGSEQQICVVFRSWIFIQLSNGLFYFFFFVFFLISNEKSRVLFVTYKTNIDDVGWKRRYSRNILQWSKNDFKSQNNTNGDYCYSTLCLNFRYDTTICLTTVNKGVRSKGQIHANIVYVYFIEM